MSTVPAPASPRLPGPSPRRRHPPGKPGPGRRGPAPARQLKRLTLAATTLAALITGIVIGNGARKRMDRWGRAY